ncbi:hypothetical protein GBAR_LOCUS8229, partial [Geodia barretti]
MSVYKHPKERWTEVYIQVKRTQLQDYWCQRQPHHHWLSRHYSQPHLHQTNRVG